MRGASRPDGKGDEPPIYRRKEVSKSELTAEGGAGETDLIEEDDGRVRRPGKRVGLH